MRFPSEDVQTVRVVGLAGVKGRGINGPEDVLKWRDILDRFADL